MKSLMKNIVLSVGLFLTAGFVSHSGGSLQTHFSGISTVGFVLITIKVLMMSPKQKVSRKIANNSQSFFELFILIFFTFFYCRLYLSSGFGNISSSPPKVPFSFFKNRFSNTLVFAFIKSFMHCL